MLKLKERWTCFKYLGMASGLYTVGKYRKAIKRLQDKYFDRKADRDMQYGPNTDILLVNAYRVKKYAPNFKLDDFKCECGGKYCTGWHTYLDTDLLKGLQSVRNKYGKPIDVTSGLRCHGLNNVYVKKGWAIANSKHTMGKAVDFYGKGVTTSVAGRKKVSSYIKKLPNYTYTYCNINGNHPNMGNAIHMDFK